MEVEFRTTDLDRLATDQTLLILGVWNDLDASDLYRAGFVMALWTVSNPPAVSHGFDVVTPEEVLDAFDVPLTFTFRNAGGALALANLCAVGQKASRYLVTLTSEIAIADLKNGLVTLRDAIIGPKLWLLDVNAGGEVVGAWETSAESLPPETIPDVNALLTAETFQK